MRKVLIILGLMAAGWVLRGMWYHRPALQLTLQLHGIPPTHFPYFVEVEAYYAPTFLIPFVTCSPSPLSWGCDPHVRTVRKSFRITADDPKVLIPLDQGFPFHPGLDRLWGFHLSYDFYRSSRGGGFRVVMNSSDAGQGAVRLPPADGQSVQTTYEKARHGVFWDAAVSPTASLVIDHRSFLKQEKW
jgi:hypothetical protein